MALSVSVVQAAPDGGQVVSGSGSISQAGNTTTIQQSSQNLSVNWQSFNVAAQETVNFVQPSPIAIAVNRIFDTNGSQILGHINANGQVWLINPNGVLFGQGAQVNVGGLVASTLDVNDASLNSNSISFSGTGKGSVVNQGTINAANGGYVALLGNHVSNQGTITAQLGTVALGAGSAAMLTFNGNSLVHMQIDQSVLNSLAENGGLIKADGGQVIMTAGAKNSLLASVVNNTGVIEARTVNNHNGVITLLGGMQAGTVNVGGILDASAPNGGNGGFIETSAAHVNVANDVKVTTAAISGLSGTWLIDPVDFTIAATGGNMTGAALTAALGGGNVTIMSTNGTTGTAGDVNVNDIVSWSANTLTLNAQNNININSTMYGSGIASLTLLYGQSSTDGGTSTYNVNAAVNLSAGNHFSTQKGSNVANLINYTVVTSLGAAGSTTATDLQGMSGNLAGHYALGSNIDAAATATWNAGAGFTPVGDATTNFTGTFDGLGHTISNLSIYRPTTDDVGLFGYTGTGSMISNVGMVGGVVSGGSDVGELVGFNSLGTINNSYATGNVNGTGIFVGGLVGVNDGVVSDSYAMGNVNAGNMGGRSEVGGLVGDSSGTISNSYATGNVSGTGYAVGGLVGGAGGLISNSYATGNVSSSGVGVEGENVGGLVGINNGVVSDSYATGNVSGTGCIGGLIGSAWNGSSISNSYATGNVSGTGYAVGGLVGWNWGSTISNSYATGSVSGIDGIGGLVGYNDWGSISTSYATGSVNGQLSIYGGVGGLVGTSNGIATVSNSYWNTQSTGQLTSDGGVGLTTAQMQVASNFVGFNFTTTPSASGNNWVMVDADGSLNNAGGASGATFPMLASEYSTTINNAHQLQLMAMDPTASYTLGQNINASNTATASGFKDVWNTTGGFISVGNSTTPFTGVFDGLGHTISNLTINLPTTDNVGLFGYTGAGSVIRNVGLVGGNVNGSYYVGGLVGYNYGGAISNSYNTGSVNGTGYAVGGLVGYNSAGIVNNSYTTGNVSGYGSVGGLVGFNMASTATVSDSYATGNVSGTSSVGGLVGFNNSGTISTSYATGNVGGHTYVGGLVGYNFANIRNSFATGNVNGTTHVGGLAGLNYATIKNSYAAGIVSGTNYVGGFLGRNSGVVDHSYWNTSNNATGIGFGSAIGATGLTSAQMQIASNYVGWNFANVWAMGAASPMLRSIP